MYNKDLPLVDLHRHLDGNIRPKTIWQLAEQNNVQLPVAHFNDFLPYVQIQQSEPDLVSFLKKLDWGVSVLKSLDDVKRIAFENVEDAFNAGIHYAELRFSPLYIAQSYQLHVQDVVNAIIDGVQAGCNTFGIKINLIGIMSRTYGIDKCQEELDALLAYKNQLVAIDLAGDEYNFPGTLFNAHFKQVRDAGLNVTVHAGEAAGADSIWQAITELGATRIGHGVACQHDQKLMDYMAKHKIAIESCLTSNFQTGTVKDLTNHPIKTFLNNDMLVCLNTDDPAVENTELKDEFVIASTIVKLTEDQISTLQTNAVHASFLSQQEKQALLIKHK